MKLSSILDKSSGLKKYFLNTFWLFAEHAQNLILAFIVGIFIARYLGPEDYGRFSYAQGFVGLFAVLTQMGLKNIVVRDIVRDRFTLENLLGAGWALQFLGGLLSFLLAGLSFWFIGGSEVVSYMVWIIGFSETVKSFSIIKLYFQAKVKSKGLAQVSLFQNILIAILKVSLILLHASVVWFALVVLINSIISAIGLIYIYNRSNKSVFSWSIKKEVMLALLKDSWPMIFYGMAMRIQTRIDQVMLGKMIGEEEVGHYSIAFKIIEIFVMLPLIVIKSLSPSITQAKEKGKELYFNRLLNLYRLMFIIFLFYSTFIFLTSEHLIVFAYGEEYRKSGILLSLFSIRLLFNCMGLAKSTFITNENLFRHALITACVGAIVNIVANYYLIPAYQSKGAIVATIISLTFSIFLVDFINKKTRENLSLMARGMTTFFLLRKV